MAGGSEEREERTIVYCLIPPELAPQLHDLLRQHFRDDPNVEVVVERRRRERRSGADRRASQAKLPAGGERRQIRGPSGRRVGERRAALVPVEARPLPRRARRHAERLTFVGRLEPSTQHAEDLDTARLVARFQAGERDAFTTLYTRYFDRVYGYLRVALRDQHEAEDVTQQVFLSVLESLAEYERRRAPFRAWLFTLVRNRAVDHLRRQGRVELNASAELERRREPPGAEEPFANGLDWISDRELMLFVERLPVAQRQVLVLRYILDLTHAEIATVLGRTPTDVRTLQHRALRFLRERLSAVRYPQSRRRARMRVYRRQAPVLRMRRFSLSP